MKETLEDLKKINIKLQEIISKLEKENNVLTHVGSKLSASLDSDFEILKNLLSKEGEEEWPEAVLDFQIVDENSEEEKMDRAEGVVDILVEESLENKKFLDFGCGEGHMAKYASKECSLSIGYDLQKSEKSKFDWESQENNFLLTTNFEKVKENAPYDIILIYDVLDHSVGNPTDLLKQAASVLSDNGKIYLRCHPWCSRHGGHLYRQINKAFVHLVFSEQELEQLGYKLEQPNLKVFYPIATYNEIINNSKLKLKNLDVERQDHEEFFEKNQIVRERIKKLFTKNNDPFPAFQLAQCFVDYVLTKN